MPEHHKVKVKGDVLMFYELTKVDKVSDTCCYNALLRGYMKKWQQAESLWYRGTWNESRLTMRCEKVVSPTQQSPCWHDWITMPCNSERSEPTEKSPPTTIATWIPLTCCWTKIKKRTPPPPPPNHPSTILSQGLWMAQWPPRAVWTATGGRRGRAVTRAWHGGIAVCS